MKSLTHADKLIVALDVPTLAEAEKLVQTLSSVVLTFKIGKELFTSLGPTVVEMVHSYKRQVFLDLKFHDIPNTVASACQAATKLKVFMTNVHASGGREMMKQALAATHKTAGELRIEAPLLIGVTVLTSLTDTDLVEIGFKNSATNQVVQLAKLAQQAGLDGVVCSPQEIKALRSIGKEFLLVTPGVRPDWAAAGNQKRVMTPREAVQAGADYLVVGRPITKAQDPVAAAKKILQEMEG